MIDWARVQELQADIGAEDFDDVATLFLDEVADKIAEMGAGLSPKQHKDALHYVKGCALNLGFSALGALCQDLEMADVADPAETVRVVACFEQSRAAFRARFPHTAVPDS